MLRTKAADLMQRGEISDTSVKMKKEFIEICVETMR